MPPKGWRKSQVDLEPSTTLPEQLSFMHIPKPFKNPLYTKNATRRTQTLKTLLSREKERDKAVREIRAKMKQGGVANEGDADVKMEGDINDPEGDDKMDLDTTTTKRVHVVIEPPDEDDLVEGIDPDDIPSYFSIEAPPSFVPVKRYCDITGLEGPYRDPKTGLRYHDLGVYNYIQNLNPATIQAHLSTRGASGTVIK